MKVSLQINPKYLRSIGACAGGIRYWKEMFGQKNVILTAPLVRRLLRDRKLRDRGYTRWFLLELESKYLDYEDFEKNGEMERKFYRRFSKKIDSPNTRISNAAHNNYQKLYHEYAAELIWYRIQDGRLGVYKGKL